MSDIPRVREIIAQAAGLLPVGDPARALIEVALPLLTRESPIKRTGAKSRMMTMSVACMIWRYYRANPHKSNQEIATALNVNMGRVSEVLTRERYPEAEHLSLTMEMKP